MGGLLAALMSSLSGVFNASSTLFTMDFYSKLRPGTSQHRLVWIGRIATSVMVLIGLAWIPVIQGGMVYNSGARLAAAVAAGVLAINALLIPPLNELYTLITDVVSLPIP